MADTLHVPHPLSQIPRRQRGAALILSLVMLLLLTFMGVTAMNTANMQEKMVGNLQDSQVAFEMAEAALRQGEIWLQQQNGQPQASASPSADQVYEEGAIPDWARVATVWSGSARQVALDSSQTTGGDGWYVQSPPQFLIGELGAVRVGVTSDADVFMHYAVLAQGYGGREGVSVTLESIYAKKIN